MNKIIFILAVLFAISLAGVTLYWVALYPILRLRTKFRAHNLRDMLFLGAIGKEFPSDTKLFHRLRRLADISVSVSSGASELTLLPSKNDSVTERLEIERLLEDLEEAPKQLRHLGHQLIDNMFGAYLIQRPTVAITIACLALASLLSDSAQKQYEKAKVSSAATTSKAGQFLPQHA